ncbi:MAG: transcriptional regulator [Myxococcaceae bacterium]|nr:transcriptional regulator [Myxococcaceae bacterium]
MSQFGRKLTLWRVLAAQRDGLRLKEVAERLGVSKLTAQRDIDDLSRAGVPVEEIRAGNANLFLVRGAPPEPSRSLRGAVALDAARAALAPMGLVGLRSDFESLVVEAGRGPVFKDRGVRALRAPSEAVLNALLEGILESRRSKVRYRSRSANEDHEYTVEPYWFRLFDGLLYLEARVPPQRRPATFAAHLIKQAVVLGESFNRPKNVRRTGFGVVDGKPERVEVLFDAVIAPYIAERQWHPTQRLRRRDDGAVVFTAHLSGMHEFVGWVMSWGAHAELRSPAAWRAEVARRAKALTGRHRRRSTSRV